MTTDKPKHRWAVWVAVFLAIVLAGYPFSIGPFGLITKATGDSPEFKRVIDPYYIPGRRLPPSLRGLLARWSRLWRSVYPDQ